MAYQIISCLLLISIISGCHGYPVYAKANVGAGVDANWKANSMFSYNSGKEGDAGINFDGRSNGDWFAAVGLDGGVLVGENGEGGRGIAVLANAASQTGANIRGGFTGNIYDRTIKSGIDIGGGVAKSIGGSAGIFWPVAENNNDNWAFLNEKRQYQYQKA